MVRVSGSGCSPVRLVAALQGCAKNHQAVLAPPASAGEWACDLDFSVELRVATAPGSETLRDLFHGVALRLELLDSAQVLLWARPSGYP